MSAEHSKLPWRFEYGVISSQLDGTLVKADRENPNTSPAGRDDNMRYIVKACNAYDTLIGALGQIAYTHEHMSDEQMSENDGYVAVLMRQVAREALRAAGEGDK